MLAGALNAARLMHLFYVNTLWIQVGPSQTSLAHADWSRWWWWWLEGGFVSIFPQEWDPIVLCLPVIHCGMWKMSCSLSDCALGAGRSCRAQGLSRWRNKNASLSLSLSRYLSPSLALPLIFFLPCSHCVISRSLFIWLRVCVRAHDVHFPIPPHCLMWDRHK